MAIPRRREERDDLLWGAALPSASVPHSRVAQAPIPPNPYDPPPPPPRSDVIDPFAGPPARVQPPPPVMQAPVPALSADIAKGAKDPGPPKPSGDAQGYDPDFLDVLSAGLRGFGGQHGPSMREQRWNQEQDRNQQAEKDAYEAWLGQRKAEQDDQRLAQQDQAGSTAQRRLELLEQNMEGRKEAFGLRKDLAGPDLDANHPQNVAVRKWLADYAGIPEERTAAMTRRDLMGLMSQFNDESERAHAGEDTRIDANRAGAVAGAATSARERVQLPYDVAREERGITNEGRKELSRKERERSDVGELPGATVVNRDVYARASGDSTTRRDMEKATASARKAIKALDDMIAIREKHGTEVLPSRAQSDYDNSKSVFRGQLSVASETGTLQSFDITEYARQIPEISPTGTDALSAVSGQDIKLEQLKGLRDSFTRKLNSGVERWGIEIEGAGGAGPRKQAPAPAASDGDWEDL